MATLTKAQLRASLGITTSQLTALLKQHGLDGQDFFTQDDLEYLKNPEQTSTEETPFNPSDLTGLGLQIVNQAVSQERTIARQIAPYLRQKARINRILNFLSEELESEPVEVSIPVIFNSSPKALPSFDASLV